MNEAVPFPQPIISLTFDDGTQNHFESVRPVLNAFGLKGTFFIITKKIGHENFMNENQLLQLQNEGHEIGCHSRSHIELLNRWQLRLKREIKMSREELLEKGFAAESFAYPYGQFDERTKSMVKDAGFSGARTNVKGLNFRTTDRFALQTANVVLKLSEHDFKEKLNEAIKKKAWMICMLHEVNESGQRWSVAPQTFKNTCKLIIDSGIRAATMNTVLNEMMMP